MQKEERLVAEFLELIHIDSPSGNEARISAVLQAKLHALGFEDISEDCAGSAIGGTANNLFAYLPGTSPHAETLPTIMFSAHMDCVPPCLGIEGTIKDGLITSKGDTILGADDKSGIAAILEGIRRIREKNIPHCTIQVIFTVAEETGVSGSRHMDVSKIRADFGYVLDSGGVPGQIVYAAPGIHTFTIGIKGKAAHAGIAPETGINAIVVAAKALAQCPQGRIDHETTANIGTIHGGTANNIVADYAEVVCEARSLNAESLEKITKQIVDIFEQKAQEHHAEANIEVYSNYASYKLNHGLPVIRLAQKAAEAIGLSVHIETTGGGSDANHFNAYGIPTVPLGTGMSNVHTTDEYITVEHLEQTCQLVVSLIECASTV